MSHATFRSMSPSFGADNNVSKSFGLAASNLYTLDTKSYNFIRDASPLQIAGSVLVLVATILIAEQIVYRQRKAHLPGAAWTLPIIGKFADSLNPSLENYRKGWDSGPLSVASVFHM